MSENNEIIENCLKRWNAEDSFSKRILESFPAWIGQMTEKMRETVEIQLGLFDYYSHKSVNGYLRMLHEQLQTMNGICFENTVYTVLPNQNGRINSGSYYLIEYKEINSISKHVVFPSFSDIVDNLQFLDNIVFIDDFCGSGKTFIDFIDKNVEILKEKNVYYLVVHAMKTALNEIESFSKKNSLKIRVVFCNCTDKAFARSDKLEGRKDDFIKDSKALGISKEYILGFKNTEALISFYNTIPNNTLGIYWKKEKNYNPLIARNNEERPKWQQMKAQKKKRMESNYLNNVRKNNG